MQHIVLSCNSANRMGPPNGALEYTLEVDTLENYITFLHCGGKVDSPIKRGASTCSCAASSLLGGSWGSEKWLRCPLEHYSLGSRTVAPLCPEARPFLILSGQVTQAKLCHPGRFQKCLSSSEQRPLDTRLLFVTFSVHFQSHSTLSKTHPFKSNDENAYLKSVIVALLNCI